MYQQLTTDDMISMLLQDDNANWSTEGARRLAEHLEDLSEDIEPAMMSFNVVDIRCEYSEYTTEELHEAYGVGDDPSETVDQVRDNTILLDVAENHYIVLDASL